MAAQAGWALASAAAAGTIFTSTGAYAWLDELAVPLVLLLLAPLAFAAPADRMLLLRSVAVVALFATFISLAQSLDVLSSLVPAHLLSLPPEGGFVRAGGPFLQVGANGAAFAMSLPFTLALARWAQGIWKAVGLCSAAACLLGSLLTLTRSAWIGIVGAGIVYLLFNPSLRKSIPLLLGSLTVAVAVVIETVPGLREATIDRLGTERSLDDRTTTNAAAVSMLEQHSLGGIGWGRFLAEVDDYVRQLDAVPLTTTHILAHNVILSRAAELGIIGAVLLIGSLALGPIRASLYSLRHQQGAWQGVLPAAFVGWFSVAMFTPMGYPYANYLLWTAVGISLALESGSSQRLKGPSSDALTGESHAAEPRK